MLAAEGLSFSGLHLKAYWTQRGYQARLGITSVVPRVRLPSYIRIIKSYNKDPFIQPKQYNGMARVHIPRKKTTNSSSLHQLGSHVSSNRVRVNFVLYQWSIIWVVTPPRIPVANEGFLYRDPLLKMVHNPGGDWHPGRGHNPIYNSNFVDDLTRTSQTTCERSQCEIGPPSPQLKVKSVPRSFTQVGEPSIEHGCTRPSSGGFAVVFHPLKQTSQKERLRNPSAKALWGDA